MPSDSTDDSTRMGPYIEEQYAVTVTAKVEATLRGTIRVDRADVAKWAECDESEVTIATVQEYVEECEDAFSEDDLDLVDVTDWERVDAAHDQTFRVQITPPGYVPLWEDEHEHTDRGNRDMCLAGRCYLDTIVDRSTPNEG